MAFTSQTLALINQLATLKCQIMEEVCGMRPRNSVSREECERLETECVLAIYADDPRAAPGLLLYLSYQAIMSKSILRRQIADMVFNREQEDGFSVSNADDIWASHPLNEFVARIQPRPHDVQPPS
jgi:hypothetical protein